MKNLVYSITRLSLFFSALALSTASVKAEILYQNSFDADGIITNQKGTGGKLLNRTIFARKWVDDGNLSLSTNGTHYRNRGIAYTKKTWEAANGFKLDVTYQIIGGNGGMGGSTLAWGLISTDTDLSTYGNGGTSEDSTGYSPFGGTDAEALKVYSIGISAMASSTSKLGLNFVNGSKLRVLDQSGNNAQFADASPSGSIDPSGPVTVSFSIHSNGEGGANWTYSIDGTTEASGKMDHFDFTKKYRFAVYGQDDNRHVQLDSVTLTNLTSAHHPPAPSTQSSSALIDFGSGTLILLHDK